MADLDYNALSHQLFRPENIEAMMLPPLEAENGAAEPAPASPLPDELPILPLRGVVVYPLTAVPLTVGQTRSIQLIDDAVLNKKIIGLVASKDASIEEPAPDQCYTLGTAATVQRLLRLPDGTIRLLVLGLERIRITEYTATAPYLRNVLGKHGGNRRLLSHVCEPSAGIFVYCEGYFRPDVCESLVSRWRL